VELNILFQFLMFYIYDLNVFSLNFGKNDSKPKKKNKEKRKHKKKKGKNIKIYHKFEANLNNILQYNSTTSLLTKTQTKHGIRIQCISS